MNLKYKADTYIATHLTEMQSLMNRLLAMKMVLHAELQALLLLSSLANSWGTLVIHLVIQPQMVWSPWNKLLRICSMKRQEDRIHISHKLFIIENRRISKSRKPQGRYKGRSKSREKLKYFQYGKGGYMKRNCRILKGEMTKNKEKKYNEHKDIIAAMLNKIRLNDLLTMQHHIKLLLEESSSHHTKCETLTL